MLIGRSSQVAILDGNVRLQKLGAQGSPYSLVWRMNEMLRSPAIARLNEMLRSPVIARYWLESRMLPVIGRCIVGPVVGSQLELETLVLRGLSA